MPENHYGFFFQVSNFIMQSTLVFQYTQGNNLSTVFAVEEMRNLTSYEEVITQIEHSGIGAGMGQYYQHIWNFVKQELATIGLGIPYPESVVACPILLMNGRVDTRILASALSYRLSETDWHQIFDRLYPLIVPCDNTSEFTLFHNDFRVFLMGVINGYQAKYKEIAMQLAEYLYNNNEGLLIYVSAIPLLCCADRKDLIPQMLSCLFVKRIYLKKMHGNCAQVTSVCSFNNGVQQLQS